MTTDVTADLLTVRDWIRWGASEFQRAQLFFGHGTDNAWDEAVHLVLWHLRISWDRLPQVADARLSHTEKQSLLALLRRRIDERIPAPYLTGEAYFAGLAFKVNEQVLIPRSPIAELIEQSFQPWLVEPPERILDLCTGSGCIGIACALQFDDADVDLSDVSAAALAVADDNVQTHQLQDRVRTVQSDLFEQIPGSYDLIVCNPPYVDAEDMASLPAEFHREPELALASGRDGLDFTRRLLREAAAHLTDHGVLVVEVGNSAAALEEAYPEVPFTWLAFERGGDGVFVLTRQQLVEYSDVWR